MEVFLLELAEQKLKKLNDYLLEKSSYEVKKDFLAKLTAKIEHIALFPESCQKSTSFGGIFKCVVTKQTTFFYRVNIAREKIEIIMVFDTSRYPNKLNQQLD